MAKPQRRNVQIIRQWEILRTLEERPSTLQQLAFDFSVNVRTVRRDLEALQEARFPVYNERHDDGAVRWHLLTTKATPDRRAA
jgi:predicted DNA-binding transcriptional regulator YafY